MENPFFWLLVERKEEKTSFVGFCIGSKVYRRFHCSTVLQKRYGHVLVFCWLASFENLLSNQMASFCDKRPGVPGRLCTQIEICFVFFWSHTLDLRKIK